MSGSDARSAAPRRAFPWVTLLCGLVAIAVLVALGTWQVRRLAWKEGLIATVQERLASPPRPLSEIEKRFAGTGDIDYWPVTVTGRFEHRRERHFFATWKGNSGYFVYTPLRLADGRAVFINRGFVPYEKKDPATRGEGQVEGEVIVTGLARNPLAEKPSFVVPDNAPDKNIFYWKDLPAMAASAGLEGGERLVPFFIDAGDAPNPGGLPVGGVTVIDFPNNHLQYAVTWYGLAAALAAVLVLWLRRRGREEPAIRP